MSISLYETSPEKERAILVGVQKNNQSDLEMDYQMEELAELAKTAGAEIVGQLRQKRDHHDRRTMIGKGKIEELNQAINRLDATLVIFYQELGPSQYRNISEEIDVKLIDRVQLILDIFAGRARSNEGKLQVALAQHEYLMPRLQGQGQILSRLGGGIGTRGPGETQLETDRRHIRREINQIKDKLKTIEEHRHRTRAKRQQSDIFQVGLIGYTNAGKSTVLEGLTGSDTYVMDQLFATLDPLTRQIDFDNGFQATITDTVGFIQDLPPQIIDAFHSTLEESRSVDLLLHVIDMSHPNYDDHIKTVEKLLADLEMDDIPMVRVFNKRDLVDAPKEANHDQQIVISAYNVEDIERLKDFLLNKVKETLTPLDILLPAKDSWKIEAYKADSLVEEVEFDEENNAYQVKIYTKSPNKWVS